MSSFASYPEIQPKLDVLGIGVYLGFGALAYLILFFCTASYLIDHEGVSQPIDRLRTEALTASWEQRGCRLSDKWSKALRNAVLILSEQQLITGISILFLSSSVEIVN